MQAERKRGAKGAARTELVAVRFDPKTKYLLEIASRIQRRSASAFIEGAVEDALKRVELFVKDGVVTSVFDAGIGPGQAPLLWDPLEADRFIRLAEFFPQLMDVNEQRRWKLILEVLNLRRPVRQDAPKTMPEYEVWRRHPTSQAEYELIRKHWDLLSDAADTERPASEVDKVLRALDPPEQVATSSAAAKPPEQSGAPETTPTTAQGNPFAHLARAPRKGKKNG